MVGASKRRGKGKRLESRDAPQQPVQQDKPVEPIDVPKCRPDNFETFDGPSDDRSSQGRSVHGFGPGTGFDPARDDPALAKPQISSRLELPADAYRKVNMEYNFPPDLPQRPGLNTLGTEVQIRVNQYKVLQWPQQTIYQYDIFIGNGSEKRGLVKAVWNSKSVQSKLKMVDDKWLFDGNKIAWCSKKPARDSIKFIVDLDKEKGRPPRIDKATGLPKPPQEIFVRLSMTGQIHMAVIDAYLKKQMMFDNTVLEAITFLDHCMRQMPSEEYTSIKRSFYSRVYSHNNHGKLDSVIEALKGVYSSMRLCQPIGSFGTSTGLAVNVDVANGTFWIPQVLAQSVRNFLDPRLSLSYETMVQRLRPVKKDGRWTMSDGLKNLRKYVKLRFSVRHRGKMAADKIYTIKDFYFEEKLGDKVGDCKNVTFSWRDKNNPNAQPQEISVYNYFLKQYNLVLNQWYLPVVRTERDGLFPMEVCNILPNQIYRYKSTPEQTAAMIKFAVTRPKERLKAIQEGVHMLKWKDDPYLSHYGIKIDTNMTVTKARLLPNPEVNFATSKVNPLTSGRWDLRNRKFFKPNTQNLESWGICVVHEAVDEPTLQNFMKVFISTYVGHGGKVVNKNPYVHIMSKNEDLPAACIAVRNGVIGQSKMMPQIILFVLPSKLATDYERLKKNMECRFGLFSQMMQSAHVKVANPQYCSNVCMKLNAKLGGTTCRAGPSFNIPTMIIGADVSHPSPGSPQPSMAALTVSMDKDCCRYAAAVQTNGHRVEMITTANINHMLMPLFQHWMKIVSNGTPPHHIYYFRDGVSEGQYQHVREQEVADMKKAIKIFIDAKCPQFSQLEIKFTVVVASKRHHLRFFPKDGDMKGGDKNGNALPGTLVERDVTHPFEYDFYLSSHSAIQGTARPTHYHVLMDEANVHPNVFQRMIYHQCYQYMRSTTPVSLHPAVYYAHLASNRARAHEDAPASAGPRGGQKFVEQEQDKAILAAMRGQKHSAPSILDRETQARPLIPLAKGAPYKENGKDVITQPMMIAIRSGMWYI